MAKGKAIGGVIVGIIVIAGCNAAMNNDDNTSTKKPAAGAKAPAREDNKSQAQTFADCVNKNGTPTEKAAAKHITKVTGTDKRNDVLDNAEVYTDFTGGLVGPHQGEGKLIAAAFTSCYKSDNGLVTVYDRNGKILATDNY